MRADEAPPPVSSARRDIEAVPEPPKPLCRAEREWWETLWRLPVAGTWGLSEEPLVLVLAKLYARVDEEVTAGLAGQIASIGSQLGLNPKARAELRIHVLDPTPTETPSVGRERFRAVG
jgi:hypothetical protein